MTLVVSGRRTRNRWPLKFLRQYGTAYLFISPWLIGIAVFAVFPLVYSVIVSFTDYDLLTPPRFNGLDNFRRMAGDPRFMTALGNTAFYTFISVPAQLVVALAMALMLNQRLRGINIFRTLFYLPTVTPTVASVLVFMYLLNPDFGLFNTVLGWFGFEHIKWLDDPQWSKPSLIIMSLWSVGGQMIIFLAGLQSVPEALLEAASIDGAGRLRKFWHVTVPMITPTIFFNVVLGIIYSFQSFTTAFIATGGGPVDSTLFYVLWIYRNAFQNFRMGYASATSWVLLAIILAVTLVQFRTSRRWVYYESEDG